MRNASLFMLCLLSLSAQDLPDGKTLLDGESKALVVFLPLGASGTTQNYLTQGLMVTAGKPGDWNRLEITGDRWIYSSESEENGAKVVKKRVKFAAELVEPYAVLLG